MHQSQYLTGFMDFLLAWRETGFDFTARGLSPLASVSFRDVIAIS